MDGFDELQRRLERLLELVEALPTGPDRQPWQANALSTIRENVASYLAGLRSRLPQDRHKAACRVSGIRKGISDLGLVEPGTPILQAADEADTLATTICAAGAPAD